MKTPGLQSVGQILRQRRTGLGLSLQQLADRAGCARSYLSEIENGHRANPPGDALLGRLEGALGLERGALVDAARWQSTPPAVRREVQQLQARQRAARKLAQILRGGSENDPGGEGVGRPLDEAYRSGELRRLVEQIADDPQSLEPVPLPREVPLINKVAAGYPTEFTDLGYPARVADEYVRVPDLDDPDAFAARVVGDSMEPEYREGDVVVFSPLRDVRPGADCFVRFEHDAQTTFKRVYFETGQDGEELIRLQPLNSAYPPRAVHREEVAGLYAAVSVTRRLA